MTNKWTQTSASQHSAFQRCQRYWYFGWIDKIKGPTTPAMQRGTDIHDEVEHYLKNGAVRTSKRYTEKKLDYAPYVNALIPHLPEPLHPDLIVEQRIQLECGPGLPWWLGFIDIGFSGYKILQIRDLKSTSDFRYAKTEKELLENIQLMSYAKWVYEQGHTGPIDLGHIYIKTEKKIVRPKPKTKVVAIEVSQGHVEDVWNREMATVAEMVDAACVSSAHDLPPTTSACGMYGGCPHREQCGITPEMTLSSLFKPKQKEGNNMGNKFLEKMRAKAATKDTGIVPPDAPSRETSPEEAEKIRAEQQAKLDKAKAAEEKKAAKAAKAAEKKAAAAEKKKGTNGKSKPNGKTKGFVLYVNCGPQKNVESGVEPTLFEDWFGPISLKMDEVAQETKKVPSWWFLPFGEQKGLIQLSIQESIERLPPAMILMTRSPGASDAEGILIPHATHVIRGK